MDSAAGSSGLQPRSLGSLLQKDAREWTQKHLEDDSRIYYVDAGAASAVDSTTDYEAIEEKAALLEEQERHFKSGYHNSLKRACLIQSARFLTFIAIVTINSVALAGHFHHALPLGISNCILAIPFFYPYLDKKCNPQTKPLSNYFFFRYCPRSCFGASTAIDREAKKISAFMILIFLAIFSVNCFGMAEFLSREALAISTLSLYLGSYFILGSAFSYYGARSMYYQRQLSRNPLSFDDESGIGDCKIMSLERDESMQSEDDKL